MSAAMPLACDLRVSALLEAEFPGHSIHAARRGEKEALVSVVRKGAGEPSPAVVARVEKRVAELFGEPGV